MVIAQPTYDFQMSHPYLYTLQNYFGQQTQQAQATEGITANLKWIVLAGAGMYLITKYL